LKSARASQYCPTTIARNTIVCCVRFNDRSRKENGHSRIADCLYRSFQPTIRIVDEGFAIKSGWLHLTGFAV